MTNVKSITPNEPANFTPELGNYKSLQPFRFWCQKVLPLVYDDSLSYYELLCKVVDYLNKTMEDVETLHGDITNLHTAYDELQKYVNNYFSTLDIQQEINNKLDLMSIDGSLLSIIKPDIINSTNTWLNEHITNPSNPPIDTSLSISGAAGDAKITGDYLRKIAIESRNIINYDNVTWGSYYNYDSSILTGTNKTGRISIAYSANVGFNSLLLNVVNFDFSLFDVLVGGITDENNTPITGIQATRNDLAQTIEISWSGLKNKVFLNLNVSRNGRGKYAVYVNETKNTYLDPGMVSNDLAINTSYLSKSFPFIYADWFGSIGDGITDSTDAINRALKAVENSGGCVLLGSGTYLISSLNIPKNVTLCGCTSGCNYDVLTGTILSCISTSDSAITLNYGSAIKNITFYYPNQSIENGAVKYQYPPSITVANNGARCLISNIKFINSYIGIKATDFHYNLTVENVQGYCIIYGIQLDNSLDVDRFTNVHFNYNIIEQSGNFMTKSEADKYLAITRANGIAFSIFQSDWAVFDNCFCWGYRIGFRLNYNKDTSVTGLTLTNCGCDACGLCVSSNLNNNLKILGCTFTCFNPITNDNVDCDEYSIFVQGGNDLTIENCQFFGIAKNCIRIYNINSIITGNTISVYTGASKNYGGTVISLQNGYCVFSNNTILGNINAGTRNGLTISNTVIGVITSNIINGFVKNIINNSTKSIIENNIN